MTKNSVVMNLSIFFLFLVPHVSVSSDYFQACEPKNCGTITIKYPFYIKGQQDPFCGHPGYEVTCINKNDTFIKLSDDNYVIQQISYELQTVNVVNTAFYNTILNCSLFVSNLTLDKNVFQFATQHGEVYFLQNCTEEGKRRIERYDELLCKDGNRTQEIVASFNVSLRELGGKYRSMVSVPYEMQDVNDIERLVRSGLRLKWTVGGCNKCANSGGRCGYNRTSSQLQCFCPYGGPAADTCHPKKRTVGLIFGSSVAGGIIILTVTAVLMLWYHKKRKFVSRSGSIGRSKSDLEKGSIYFGVPLFSYTELEEATDNFNRSKELGDGGFGTVYHGKLRDGREVAVKRLFERSYKRVEQFLNEVQILTCLRHQNLVSLYGCTSSHCRELILVYEYVPNGTVADHLYGAKSKPAGSLPWHVRLRIALETASALTYLHASDIIHRDVKTNNILLDNSFNVKVADFGLSRLFPTDVTHVSTAPQGTPGYLDPEYHQCYQLTDKSDVYSFGVVLMELISSLPAVDMNRVKQEINLSNYAMNKIQRSEFHLLVDPQLGFGSDFKVRRMTIAVAELAFQCLQHDKEFRPSMDEVLEGLKRIESADYDHVLKDDQEVEKTDDDAKLLANHKPQACSPNSVMDSWGSRSTISSTNHVVHPCLLVAKASIVLKVCNVMIPPAQKKKGHSLL